MKSISQQQFGAFEKIFSYLNQTLFDNSLPDCMLQLSRRSNKTKGSFKPSTWTDGNEVRHEITLNPLLLERQNKEEILSVICHNMVHLWQFTNSDLSEESRKYHNRRWVEKMESIGLVPYNTIKKGGKQTGKSVSQTPKPHGLFLKTCKAMPDKYLLPFRVMSMDFEKHQKVGYHCPQCKAKFWGKQNLKTVCNCTHNDDKSFEQELLNLVDKLSGKSVLAKQNVKNLIDKYMMVAPKAKKEKAPVSRTRDKRNFPSSLNNRHLGR